MEKIKGIKKKLSWLTDIATRFTKGEINEEQLIEYLNDMSVITYLPLMEKLKVVTEITTTYFYTNSDMAEVKIQMLYQNLFFDVLLKEYCNIDYIGNSDLLSVETYDLLYPVINDYIMSMCKQDYNQVIDMVFKSITLYTIQRFTNAINSISVDALEENVKANVKLLNSLEKNEDLIRDLADIANFDNPNAADMNKIIKGEGLIKKNKTK